MGTTTQQTADQQQLMGGVIRRCLECVQVCEQCAVACIDGASTDMTRCAKLCLDVAELSRSCATLCSRDSEFTAGLARVCADACEACAAECEKGCAEGCAIDDVMRRCAEACRRCAETCRQMATAA